MSDYYQNKFKRNQEKIRRIVESKRIYTYNRKGDFALVKISSVPKWLIRLSNSTNEHDIHTVSKFIEFRGKKGRWPNNIERILNHVSFSSRFKIPEIVKRTGIDKKNIGRYLKQLSEKGLIEIERDYTFKETKTGELKRYYYNAVRVSYDQAREIKKILKKTGLD